MDPGRKVAGDRFIIIDNSV